MTTTLDRPDIHTEPPAPAAPTGAGRRIRDLVHRVGSRAVAAVAARRDALVWLLPVLVVAAIVNFVNIGGSPQRIDDEGTYTAQAWAVTHFGELAHYTYWYDHPPLGWLQLAGYAQLTGAFARWDVAVLAAREAVIVAALISVVLVWMIARRLHLSRPAAAGAALLFAVSPLAVQFHRTVYLDNVATPWLLLAIVLALNKRGQLLAFAGSALALGIAVLSKETYLLALPLVAWLMIRGAHRETRRYTLSVAGSVLALLGTSYLLLALVKGELLPGDDRVSLIGGIQFQLSGRAGSGSLLDPDSLVNRTLSMWWQLDPVFIVAGVASAIAGLFVRRLRPFAITVLALVAFMFRPGGYLPVPYIIMLLPFAAILVAGVADAAVRRLRAPAGGRTRVLAAVTVTALAGAAIAAVPLWTTQLRGFLLSDLDQPMRAAEGWLEQNASTDERIIVDDAMWVDLVRAGWSRDNVVWYYKLDTDPAVMADSPEGWRDSDYIITTDSMRTFPDAFPEVDQAITNSVVVASFGQDAQAVQVRRILPAGTDAASVDAAVSQRASLGAQLAANPAVSLSDEARAALVAGSVDERIVAVLGALAADGGVSVSSFPGVPGEDERMLRQVAVTSIGGAPAAANGTLSPAATTVAASLTGDFAPARTSAQGDALVLTYPVSVP